VTRREIVLTAIVFAAFAALAAWRSSVPGLDEPHYLGKARHFWDPSWCGRDLFFNSANAHWTFYAVVGPLTRVFSLEATAWIGRIVVWAGLAWAWVRLVGRMLPGGIAPITSACFFLALQAGGSLAGEWLVDGVESKSFAYAALFAAIAAASRQAWREAALAAGIAIAFHPVIGVWGLVGILAASSPQILSATKNPGVWRRGMAPAALCLAASLPGAIPALAMLASSVRGEVAQRASAIQVFERLGHHLDPLQFPLSGYVYYAALLVVWAVLSSIGERSPAARFFSRFVLATLGIAACGFAVGLTFRWAGLMRFYPFRLFDLFLPMAVAIEAARLIERLGAGPAAAGQSRPLWAAAGCALAACALLWCFLAPGRIENASRWKPETWAEFVDACGWIKQNTPADALFLTPRFGVGFTWYAERAEYVNWKDCPQDAASILEWKRRLDVTAPWQSPRWKKPLGAGALARLAGQTGIDYVLAWRTEPYRVEPEYQNRVFAVYKTSKTDGAREIAK